MPSLSSWALMRRGYASASAMLPRHLLEHDRSLSLLELRSWKENAKHGRTGVLVMSLRHVLLRRDRGTHELSCGDLLGIDGP